MKKLLHIIASPREEASRTLQVAKAFLEGFKAKNPDFVIDELNLTAEKLPDLSAQSVSGKYVLMDGKDLYGQLKVTWAEIIQYIEQFSSSDVYLISTPMWNFSIPYPLKHYIDLIVQPKYLFQMTKGGGAEGLMKNKKMIVIESRGGQYSSKEAQGLDFQEPYLKTIFGFVGITDIAFIKAEGMDLSDPQKEQRLQQAIEAAKKLAGL